MTIEEQTDLYAAGELMAYTADILRKVGVPADEAELVADSLVESHLRGVDSHGIARLLGIYVKRLRQGVVKVPTQVTVERDAPSTALLDGGNGLGAVVAARAMEIAIAKAQQTGAAWVGVHNTNHFGAAAYWALMAAQHDMIGIAMTNGPSAVAPWGGKVGYLGTNPICFAVPAGEEQPVVVDMATSLVARGHIFLAAQKGASIPEGWAMDARGRPTTDPNEALKGLVLPMAGHKGYALSVAIEILSGVLTGALIGPHIGSLYQNLDRPQDVGSFFGAIAVDRFAAVEQFKARMDAMIREIRATPLAEGFERIMLPGEPEYRKKEQRRRAGIPLAQPIVDEFIQLGQELGVRFPDRL